MAIRIRKSVYALPQGDTTISWYRKAVDVLLKKPVTDPASWRYLAAVHAVQEGMSTPSAAEDFWDQCQHQSWFFLSWHRGYVAAFEAVIANTIVSTVNSSGCGTPVRTYATPITAPFTIAAATVPFTVARIASAIFLTRRSPGLPSRRPAVASA